MSSKRSRSSSSDNPVHEKKTRVNGFKKKYKYLNWVEASLKKSLPVFDYFSFAEQVNDSEEITNTNFKDLLLTLQNKQTKKLTNIAHTAETTFNNRCNKNSEFGKQYSKYWEDRKDRGLEEEINDESRATISSIQKLVNVNIRGRAENIFGSSTSSTSTSTSPSVSNAPNSNTTVSDSSDSEVSISKALEQATNLASDQVGELNIVDLSSQSVLESLKTTTTDEQYEDIMQSITIKEAEIGENANQLIQAIGLIKPFSNRELRNTLYENGYKKDLDFIGESDTIIIENLVRHFLDLIESPKNPLNVRIMERTAAVYTSIIIINQLFLSVNDIVELEWLEREYYQTNKTKWDGILFKTGDHTISPGFIEFSGGANGAATADKERRDIIKLYKMMAKVIKDYPAHIKKEIFCMRYFDNYIYFEKLAEHNGTMFRVQHLAVTVPTTVRLLVKFVLQIPKLISWKKAVVQHVERF